MQIYSVYPRAKTAQVVSDVVAVVAVITSVVAGFSVWAGIESLVGLGRDVESAGAGFEGTMADAARGLGAIPLIGQSASSPFLSASEAGSTLASAGRDQQDLISQIAIILGILVAVIPITLIGLLWFRRRLQFAQRARSTTLLAETAAGLEILALRTLMNASPEVLSALAPASVSQWRAGDPATTLRLAQVEMARRGIRTRV